MYRYYLTQRPFAPGTFPGRPSDWADISDRGRVFAPEISRKAWAWVEYESPLTQKEVDGYELVPVESPLPDSEEAVSVADAIIALVAHGYLAVPDAIAMTKKAWANGELNKEDRRRIHDAIINRIDA